MRKLISNTIVIVLFFFLVQSSIEAQRMLKLSLSVDGKTEHVSYITRKGISYASAKEIVLALGGNFYYSDETAKLELKFSEYNLKLTGRNQFVVLTNRSNNNQNVFQLPISTLLVQDDVMIPMIYVSKVLSLAYGKEINYDDGRKHISITEKSAPIIADIPIKDEKPVVSPKPEPVKEKDTKTVVASKYDIYDMAIDEKSNGTMIRLKSQKNLKGYRSSIKNNTLYLFLTGTSVDPSITQVKPFGLVKKVERKTVAGNIQLEFQLKDNFAAHETFRDVESDDILISIQNKMFDKPVVDLVSKINEWKFDVVVIDAGHGGKDPGAIGVTGVREKDVNLGIALKLGKLIEQKIPGVKVVYTRDNDTFVELFKRGKIANEANGKLFISIHCNALKQKPSTTRGFEVYLLRPGRTQRAIEIAEFENSVIHFEEDPNRYQALTDENFILVSMAHSAYMRYSEKFSDILNQKWTAHTKIPSRGIKQAGFYVLVGASMPSVLIETGFLTNREDEAYLKSEKGQKEIANAILNSVIAYKDYYDKALLETSN
ncbi:MAG: N-acetylmuramoyl-L-alanine amidase [Melioribacteraceae bacterium]|nr:MAG: N-acetylmuramoyl-L-alanine amidase [Melioribacteraceae bacterium]